MAYFREEKNGTWYFVVDTTKYLNVGKRKQTTRRGFESEAAARKAADKLISDLEAGKKPQVTRLGEFITHYYENVVVNQVEEGTYETQWNVVEKHIIPRLGKYPIDKITVEQLDEFYNQLVKEGVSRGYIKNVALVISKTFRQAMRWGRVLNNVAREANKPSYTPADVQVWTKDQLALFLNRSRTNVLHRIYVLAAMSGMRKGEVLALEWTDIDVETSTIHVTKSLKYTKKKGLHIKVPKTKNSRRRIVVPKSVIQTVMRGKNEQPAGTKIVFDNLGAYYHPANIWRWFQDDCARYGLPVMKFHGLRHTHATILLAEGHNVKVVAERLGDTVGTVMKTYAHVLPGMQEKIADSLENVYKSVDNSGNVVDFVVRPRKNARK